MTVKILISTFVLLACLPLLADTAYIYSNSKTNVSASVKTVFENRGYTVTDIEASQLKDLKGSGNDILAVIGSDEFPADGIAAFNSFIKEGNHYLGIDNLPFTDILYNYNGSYYSKEKLNAAVAAKADKTILRFTPEVCSKFDPEASDSNINMQTESGQDKGEEVLHITTPAAHEWETYNLYDISPDATNDEVLVFRAKGTDTPEIWIGFQEEDGSRWLKKLELTNEYTTFVLAPSDFPYWTDSPAENRGGEGDSLNFEKITKLEFAFMTSGSIRGSKQEAFISDIRTAPKPKAGDSEKPLTMESLYPASMMTWTENVTDIKSFDNTTIACSDRVYMPIWRNPGYGMEYTGTYRQIPLAYCYENNDLRGIAAQVLVNYQNSETPGSMFGYIGNTLEYLEDNPEYTDAVLAKIAAIIGGEPRLLNGGTSVFSYLPDEKIKTGASVISGSRTKAGVTITVTDNSGRVLSDISKNIALKAGTSYEVSSVTAPQTAGLYEAAIKLYSEDGTMLDSLTQKFSVFDENSRTAQNSVLQHHGNFWVNNKKWVPYGINYWPLYSSGRTPQAYFGVTWVFPEQYNPTLIEKDMELLKSLGVNCISIQHTKDEESNPIRDMLERLKQYDIRVHLYIHACHPLGTDTKLAQKLIKDCGADKSPSMFSYDLGWEVNCGNHNARKNFDKEWNSWIEDNYGSFEEAFSQWNFTPEKQNGYYTNPEDKMISQPDDIHQGYVAAYRSFLDDYISKGYQKITSSIKEYDPYSMMGARSGYGGTGAAYIAYMFPFDLKSGIRHLDYTAPEAYNIGGDRRGFLKGQMNNLYGRFVAKGKPVMWPEYGSPILFGLSPEEYLPHCADSSLKNEGDYYRGMGDFLAETNVNGGLGWWFPGGYRTNEHSDFGIVSPDYTIRPAAEAIGLTADAVKRGYTTDYTKADYTIEIDRDKYIQGYAGIFNEYADKIAEYTMDGKKVELRTAGTGTTSANTPLLCPGNVEYKGKGPLKYLKAEFDSIELGGTRLIKSGNVSLNKNKPVEISVTAANTEESEWSAAEGYGKVGLQVEYGNTKEIYPISKNTPYLETAKLPVISIKGHPEQITLRMYAEGIGGFGETARITIEYK